MATTSYFVDPRTLQQCMRALTVFPGRLRFKHARIALNAGAGVYKNILTHTAPRDTLTLTRSFRVKVKIPDASFNKAHHGRPAYAVIGPKRGYERFVFRGKAIGAKRAGKLATNLLSIRTPSRYAHLAGPGRKSTFMQRAAAISARPAAARTLHKLQQGIREEQLRLAAENGVR